MKLSRPLRLRPTTLAVMLALGTSTGVYAADADSDAGARELSKIEVTGSRIKRADIEGESPILTITREDLDRTGYTSVGEILQALSVTGSALNTKFNSSGNFGFPASGAGIGAGTTQVNMRHLGPQRTLVLVNGLRWINETSASGVSSATDLNTIPLNMVERIEVLLDGASSVYGSDAIAGVVNIITVKDFDGLAANAYYGQFDDGDGETEKYDLTIGNTTANSSVVFSLSHTDQKRVSAPDRSISTLPNPGTGNTRGSSGTPQGRYIFVDNTSGITANITLNDAAVRPFTYDPNNPPSGSYHQWTDADRFNFAQFNLVLTPNKRTSLYAQGIFDLTDNTSFHVTGLYNNRQSTNQAAPEPIFIGPGFGTGQAETVSVDVTNPFNPFGQTLDAATNFVGHGRRPIEGGARIFEQDVDTWYWNGGFDGTVDAANRFFDWKFDYVYSRSRADQLKQGAYNIRRIAQALGPAFQRADGTFGCGVDAASEISGCVPLDLFGGQGTGGGTITPDMLGWIRFVQHDVSEQTLTDLTASVTFDAVDLPAGPLGLAFGFENRRLDGFFQPDPIVVSGDSNGIPALPTAGSYDVDSWYGEALIPILADRTYAELLDVTVSARSDDFSTFGSETTTRFGFRYKPTTDLLLRGTASEGFRAPGVGELFGSAARFDATLTDPCTAPITDPNIAANCATLGVPAGFVQVNPQISVTTGGNLNLQPETSDSYTFGAVYSPGWADDRSWTNSMDFEFTYYNHELDGTIQALDAQTQLDRCVQTLDPASCNGITRNAVGAINSFSNTLTNLGGTDTEGYDFLIHYLSPEWGVGQIDVQWLSTYVDTFSNSVPTSTGFQSIGLVGIEQNDSGIPRWLSSLITNWNLDRWNVAWTMRYIHKIEESCSDFLDGTPNSFAQLGLCSQPNFANEPLSVNKLGSTVYHDLQAVFEIGDFGGFDTSVSFGIINAFDKDPPICHSCSLNGYDASLYNVPGQFWYARVGLSR